MWDENGMLSYDTCLFEQARIRILEARSLDRLFLSYGPPRVGLRPSGKPELFHSNHSGHTGSIFLNGRSRARVAHWGHKKKRERKGKGDRVKREREFEYCEIENAAASTNVCRPDAHHICATQRYRIRVSVQRRLRMLG